jgi:hypothetical protein
MRLAALLEATVLPPERALDLLALDGPIDVDLLVEIIKDGCKVTFNGIFIPHVFALLVKQLKIQAISYKKATAWSKPEAYEIAEKPTTLFVVYHIKDKAIYTRCVWDISSDSHTFHADLCHKLYSNNGSMTFVHIPQEEYKAVKSKFSVKNGEAIHLAKLFKDAGFPAFTALITGTHDNY